MLAAKPRDEEKPCWIEKYRPEDHCDGPGTSARLESGIQSIFLLLTTALPENLGRFELPDLGWPSFPTRPNWMI